MWSAEIPAFAPFFGAALLALITRGWPRAIIMLTAPVLTGIQLYVAGTGIAVQAQLLDLALLPYRVDRLSLIFGYAFCIGAFIAVLFALRVRSSLEHAASLVYAGSALGIVFAGDLVTLFIFWEITGLSSVFLIWIAGGKRATAAGIRYLIFQVLSGVLLLAGLLWHFLETGSTAFNAFELSTQATWLMFLAFGIKAGFPLLHNWITDGYPAATPTGSVFLCIFTTKAAIYALARGFPGTELLIYIGMVMACFPVFYAVIENDMRRVLSYSMINQLGFMVVGVGIGTELSLNGTAAHAFTHIIYKALLFMSMGAVLYMTQRVNASELGGLYKTMPFTATCCIVGAASISAFPLLSGFVSKSLIMSALVKEGHELVWLAMLFASAGVFHHAGIKVPYFAFFGHDSGLRPGEAPRSMLVAMGIAALLCIVVGVFPALLYQHLPFDYPYSAYNTTHVLAQTQLLLFSALAFVLLLRSGIYPAETPSVNLDVEWSYRRLAPELIARMELGCRSLAARAFNAVCWVVARVVQRVSAKATRDAMVTGGSLLWVMALLLGLVVLSRAGA